MTSLFDGVYDSISNEDYHSDNGYYSSSQIKDMLKDPEIFYRKNVLKEATRESLSAYDVGTAFHTLVLEPHLYDKEVVLYDGIRRGAKYESFKEKHAGKLVIKPSEEKDAKALASRTRESKIAMSYIEIGKAEVSAFVSILIDEAGDIYSADKDKMWANDRWVESELFPYTTQGNSTILKLKVRADCLIESKGAILDLKSTSSNARDVREIKKSISNFEYDLSAAMYLFCFSLALNKPISRFLWTFTSKKYGNCQTYEASKDQILVGMEKFKYCLKELAYYQNLNWEIPDRLLEISPENYQLDWIRREK